MKKLILILMLLSCYDALNSQVVKEWSKEYNGPAFNGNDYSSEFVTDALNNIYVIGAVSLPTGPAAALIKYDASGVLLWKVNILDSTSDISLTVDAAGSIYVTATRGNRGIVAKYSPSGLRQWIKYHSGFDGQKIVVDASGYIFASGNSSGQVMLLKYNNAGTLEWNRLYSSGIVLGMMADNSGNIVIHSSTSLDPNNYNIVLNKINRNQGTLVWSNTYLVRSAASLYLPTFSLDAAGNVYVLFYRNVCEGFCTDVRITFLKYNASGSLAWTRMPGTYIFRWHSRSYPQLHIKSDAAGNIYISATEEPVGGDQSESLWKYNSSGDLLGKIDGAFAFDVDASGNIYTFYGTVIKKFNSSLNREWTRNYDNFKFVNFVSSLHSPNRIRLDNSGNLVLVGEKIEDSTYQRIHTAKFTTNGLFQWGTTFYGAGSDYDEARSMVVDNSGYTVVSGIVTGFSSGKDMGVVRYTPSGGVQWTRTHNGTANGDDKVNASVVDASGNIYVTGVAVNTSSGADYATIKYNSTGVRQWVALYNGTGNGSDEARSIAVDNSGNVYVTGSSRGPAGMDYATVKYNLNGTQQWVKRFNGPANGIDEAVSIALDGSGNIYVGGSTTGVSTRLDYTTVKYNSAGTFIWSAAFNGTANLDDYTSALKTDAAGNVYVTGYSSRNNSLDLEYATVKYNSAGVQQWVGRYNNGTNEDAAASLAIDAAGNVYVTGRSIGLGTGTDYATVKYNSAGIQQWSARYNGTGNSNDGATAIALDASGNIYVTGSSTGTTTSTDFATVKYNPSGTQLWVTRHDGPGTGGLDAAAAIFVDPMNKVYVAGLVFSSSSNTHDFGTVKYLQTGTSGRTLDELPAEFDLTQNYPNPFNPSTTIKFALPVGGVTTLKVYDIAGKEIASLVETDLEAGYHEVNFNASHLSSGVYFYKLTSGSYTEVKKMMLVK